MEILNNLFTIFILLSLLAFVVGLIKPAVLKLKDRKTVIFVTFSVFIVSVILFALTRSDEQKINVKSENVVQSVDKATVNKVVEVTKPQSTEKIKNSFGLTVEDFRTKFNRNIDAIGKNKFPKLTKPLVEETDGNKKFSVILSDDLVLSGDVVNDDKIGPIAVIMSDSSSKSTTANFIAYVSVLVHTLADKNDKEALIKAIKLMEDVGKSDRSLNAETESLNYLLMLDKDTGLWFFIVSPK